MRGTTTMMSNKRNSSSSSTTSIGAASGQHQRKSAKGPAAEPTVANARGGGGGKPYQHHHHHNNNNQHQHQHHHHNHQEDEAQKGKKQHHQNRQQQRANDDNERQRQRQHYQQHQQQQLQLQKINQIVAVCGSEENRKQNHCDIEKRRRDKMNHYIMELASAFPSFNNNQGKFDKLTVLRMAVQHVRSLRSSLCSFSSFHLRPSFLSSGNLLKNLILQMASHSSQDNLFMVVTCDRGKVLFVSQSSKDILNQDQDELVGQCLFDILHKDDVCKVKEQISHFNMMPNEMLVDSKTLQPIKNNQRQSFNLLQSQQLNSTPQPGARRSFFCRMRSGRNGPQATNGNMSSSSFSSPSPASSSSSSSSSSNDLRVKQTSSTSTDEDAVEGGGDEESEESGNDNNTNRHIEGGLVAIIDRQRSNTVTLKTKKAENGTRSPSSEQSQSECHIVKMTPPADKSTPYELNSNVGNVNKTNKSMSKSRGNSSSGGSSSGNSSGGGSINTNGTKARNFNGSSGGSSSRSSSGSGSYSSGSRRSSSSGIISGSQASDRSPMGDDSASPPLTKKSGLRRKSEREANQTKMSGGSGSNYGARLTVTGANDSSSDSVGRAPGGGGSSSKKHGRYIVMHCTGYLKSITLRNDEFDDDDFDDYNDENNGSDDEENEGYRTVNCMVAVCRRSPMDRDLKPDRPLTFTCRYSMEGKFVFVDQRTTVALGYTPQQILGTSHYAYCHKDSVNTFKECHRQSILKSESVSSDIYQFKRSNGQHLWLQTSLKSFRNPWTKIIDYIVANHTTAEGNDPHYNDGFVPTKFNRDMTCEGSQSSSPASCSSLSPPSMDSKKSSSPSSCSIGSSYSMESHSSGANIRALLDQIDRVKSGGIKHALDFHKKRASNRHTSRSGGGGLIRKSNEDSSTYSGLQSCSSLSSQISGQSIEFLGKPAVDYFGDTDNLAPVAVMDNMMNVLRPAQTFCSPPNYHHQQQQQQQHQKGQEHHQQQQQQFVDNTASSVSDSPRFNANPTVPCQIGAPGAKRNVKVASKIAGPQVCSSKEQQSVYSDHCNHRNENKSSSSASSETSSGIGSATTWTSSIGSVYSNDSGLQQTRQDVDQAATMRNQMVTVIGDGRSSGSCENQIQSQGQCQSMDKSAPYVSMQTVEAQTMNLVSGQVSTGPNQIVNIRAQVAEGYANDMMPLTTYISQGVNPRYNNGINLDQMRQQQPMTSELQPNMAMTIPQQLQAPAQQGAQQQASNTNQMNAPMMWNTAATNRNQYQNPNTMHNHEAQSICTTGDVTLITMDVGNSNNHQIINQQQIVQCQQCANHKCSIQQLMMTNNTDLNSINLTSLAVDGDLDEDQLLEYLTGYEPETSQLYQTQNNAYTQYNIYR